MKAPEELCLTILEELTTVTDPETGADVVRMKQVGELKVV
jgi:metal-sulfur cluster biosynthetic enzyme